MFNQMYFDADLQTRNIAEGIEPLRFRTTIEDVEKMNKNIDDLNNEPHTLQQVFEKEREIRQYFGELDVSRDATDYYADMEELSKDNILDR